MNIAQNMSKESPGARTKGARRPIYADWAVFFTAVAVLGAIVMVELSTGGSSFVAGTIDRMNANDTVARRDGTAEPRTVVYMSQVAAQKTTLAAEQTTSKTQ